MSASLARKAVPAFRLDPEEDVLLIRRCLAGDERAFTRLYTRHAVRTINFIARMIGDRERAEDLAQEAWIRVYKHLGEYEQDKKFTTWLYTIAHNLAKNELRNRSRSPLIFFQAMRSKEEEDDRPLQFEDSGSRPDEMYGKRYLQKLVADTIAALPAHHRLVFILREVEGKTYEDIAEIAHINLGTVKSRLFRARTAFATIIEPHLS